MSEFTIPLALFDYSFWANERLFQLCDGLTDEQLDAKKEMGFGSLRNTLFHILAAEEIWLERWTCQPWRAFEADSNGLALPLIRERLHAVHNKRNTLLKSHAATLASEFCEYKDAKGNQYRNILLELVIHVANHGIHHRAQALNFLKGYGRTVPGGLDFLFYRFAKPSVPQSPEATQALRQWGLEMETAEGEALAWDENLVERYFAYGDWGNDRILHLLEQLSDEALDSDRGMGVGTIRLTATHILDAERWWLRCMTVGGGKFEKLPATTSLAELKELWAETRRTRTEYLRSLDAVSAQRIIHVQADTVTLGMPAVDALVQLCGHGTHHRSQLINMIRHSGVTPPAFDYVAWVRETAV